MSSLFSTTCSPPGCRGGLRSSRSAAMAPRNLKSRATWHSPPHMARQRFLVVVSSAPGDFFQSHVVLQEFNRLNKDMAALSPMAPKYGDFDLEGKRIFLQQMEGFMDRFQIFVTRLKLAEDPMAKEMVRQLNVQLLEANTSLEGMYQGLREQCAMMRSVLAEEEQTADPEKLRMIRQAYRESFGTLARVRNIRVEDAMADPELMEGIMDPKAMLAMHEVKDNPWAIEKYKDRPALYKLLRKIIS